MTWRQILFSLALGYSAVLNVLLWQQVRSVDAKAVVIRDVQTPPPADAPANASPPEVTRELVSASSTQFLHDFSITLVEHCRSFHWVKEPTDNDKIVRYSIWLEKF